LSCSPVSIQATTTYSRSCCIQNPCGGREQERPGGDGREGVRRHCPLGDCEGAAGVGTRNNRGGRGNGKRPVWNRRRGSAPQRRRPRRRGHNGRWPRGSVPCRPALRPRWHRSRRRTSAKSQACPPRTGRGGSGHRGDIRAGGIQEGEEGAPSVTGRRTRQIIAKTPKFCCVVRSTHSPRSPC
jgi:hypothetical protein